MYPLTSKFFGPDLPQNESTFKTAPSSIQRSGTLVNNAKVLEYLIKLKQQHKEALQQLSGVDDIESSPSVGILKQILSAGADVKPNLVINLLQPLCTCLPRFPKWKGANNFALLFGGINTQI